MGLRGPKRSKLQKKRDRAIIADLYIEGKDQAEIAEMVGFSQTQISYDLKKIKQEWLLNTTLHLDAHKAEEIAKTLQAEKKYRDIYNRSREDFKSKTAIGKPTKKKDKNGNTVSGDVEVATQTVHTESRTGDVRALDGVLKCIERRCKLLGLDAPQKQEHSGKGGGPIIIGMPEGLDESKL